MEKKVHNRVLTIGSEYLNSKGGIGSVIGVYEKCIAPFKFIATYPAEKAKSPFYSFLFFSKALLKVVYWLIVDNNVEIVHIHGSHGGSIMRKFIIICIVKGLFKKKVIYHSHSSEFAKYYTKGSYVYKSMAKFVFEKADVIICLSTQWKNYFKSVFKMKIILILENIVEKPSHKLILEMRKESCLNLLFLGVIGDRKGVFDLLSVINKNKKFYRGKIKLYIGGNGDVSKLIDYIANNVLGHLVRYVGWVSGIEKVNLLLNSDIYLLPSYNEGLPISILEAMSYGKPIISTNIGGIPEIVKNGRNGLLIQPGDEKGLFDSINHFVNNNSDIISMGKESLTLVEPYYTDNVIRKLTKIYQSLLDTNGKVRQNG